MSNKIKDDIKEILFEVTGNRFPIADDVDLSKLPGIDSLIFLQFMVALEKKFKVRFPPNRLEKIFESINSLTRFLNEETS